MIEVRITPVSVKKTKEYPKLMIGSDGLIVLFYQETKGTVIKSSSKDVIGFTIGHYSDTWNMDWFDDYNEPITIQNA